jgi:hypothetical protein
MNKRQCVKNKELWLLNPSDGSKYTITEDIVCDDGSDVENHYDVAIVEINISDYGTFNNVDSHKKNFLGIERIINEMEYQSSDEESTGLLVTGYPSSKNKISKVKYKKPKMLIYATSQHPGSDTNKERLLTISAKWGSAKAEQLPKPQGMSGGGVWLLSNKSHLNPMLYAISVAYLSSENRIIAVKMTLVLTLIKCYFPGTLLDQMALPIEKISSSEFGVKLAIPLQNEYDKISNTASQFN